MTQAKLPSGWLLVRVDALVNPGATIVEAESPQGRASILLTRSGDSVAAFRNRCPHAGHPLQRADGTVLVQEGRYLVCGAHGASFMLEDGACAGGPCAGAALERIAIKVEDGKVRTA